MSTNMRPYETPWPWNEIPHEGSTIQLGSNSTATVTRVTATAIYLDNGRWFER